MPSVTEARDTAARLYRDGREAGYAEAAHEAILAVAGKSPRTREELVCSLAMGALSTFDDVADWNGLRQALSDVFYACPAGGRDA